MSFNYSHLDNGVTILTYKMPNATSVAINITIKTGSRNELETQNGISHFLEHMAFKSTKNKTARMIAEDIDHIGGVFNAFTSKEYTVYYAKVIKENLGKAVRIFVDILQNSAFLEEEIEKERMVIGQEIAQANDTPDDLAFENLHLVAYQDQALGKSILGSMKTISKFSSDDFRQYIDDHYYGQNIFVAVAGNIEHQAVINLFNEFNSFNPGTQKTFQYARYVGGYSFVEKQELEQSFCTLSFESLPYTNLAEYYKISILSIILGGGFSCRLFQELRENKALVYSVGSFPSAYIDTGLFTIYAGTSHDKVKEMFATTCYQLKIIADNLKEEELVRAKNQVRSSLILSEEKTTYKAEEIARTFSLFDRFIDSKELLSYVDKIEKKDIIEVLEQILKTKPTISIVGKNPGIEYERVVDMLTF